MKETDIEAMRWWIGDNQWMDMDEESIAALTEGQILRAIARWYDGGIAGFMVDIQAVKRRNDMKTTMKTTGGSKFRVRLTEPEARPGCRTGYVLDDAGEAIGDASDRIYGGRGFAIHTGPWAGFVPSEQVEFVR